MSIDLRTVITGVSIVVAVVALQIGITGNNTARKANHQVGVEEQARVNASCIASNESRGEIVATFHRLTNGLLRKSVDPKDLLLANEIDASVEKSVGGVSPLCGVPGVTVPSTTTTRP